MPTFMSKFRGAFQIPKILTDSMCELLTPNQVESERLENVRETIPPLFFPACMRTPSEPCASPEFWFTPTPYLISSPEEVESPEQDSPITRFQNIHKPSSPTYFFSCLMPSPESPEEKGRELTSLDLRKRDVRRTVFNRTMDLVRSVDSLLEEITRRKMIEIDFLILKLNIINFQLGELKDKLALFSQYHACHLEKPEHERYFLSLKLELNQTNRLIGKVNEYLREKVGEKFYLLPLTP
jgi:hypothetical protein